MFKQSEENTLEPKIYFDTEKELLDCLSEWKKRLLLRDWHIAIAFAKREDLDDKNWAGLSDCQWVNRCGTISILAKEDIPNDMILKQPHELTVIHELLHFKFFGAESGSLEELFYQEMQHQLLEDMAKALYMAKYKLDYSWFIEDGAKEE